jgi:chromosome segregation protein
LIVDSERKKSLNNVKNIEEEIKENTNKLGNYRRKLSIKEKNITELNKKLNGAEANYNVLINLNDQFEGYTRSVKSLMKRINNEFIKGVKDKTHVLGEVITVKKECEIAIEIAMGASISNIITDDDIIAKRLINYLKENKLGRATFLPLNIIKGRKIDFSGKLQKYNGFMGIASELVQYNEKFKNIIEYVLGRVIVADNMDNALIIAKGIHYSHKIVTLQGELVNPGGSLTGGSIYKRNASVFGRKREILELKEQSKTLKEEISVLKEQLKELNDTIKNLDEKNLNLKDKVHFENVELTKINARADAINEENKRLNDSLIERDTEIKSINKNLDFNKDSICEIEAEIDEKTTLKNDLNLNINAIEVKINDIMIKIENEKNVLTELKIKKAQLDENISSRTDNLSRIKENIKEQEKNAFDLEKEIQRSIENKQFCIKEIEENKIKNKDTIFQIENYEKRFKEYEIERLKIKEKISLNNESLDKVSMVVENYEKQFHRYQLNLTKIESEKEMFYSKLNDEMELTYAEALEFKQEIHDLNKLKEDIIKIKNEISNLGLVNVGSIEEYKEVSEKYTFMNEQREDLVTSKQEIVDVINEMTEKMKIVFKDNFKIMREYFDETFKELFKGGSADLILADGDELTAKIDINVQPPGKKLQNINLMSGGEKVLSAIALLFAILKMKPTPFCILDEIEAALDDANVYRYAEFLKKFSDKIQFIVITHRKGTMEASNVLYGITMEEKGVSKIVSVDLTEQLINA